MDFEYKPKKFIRSYIPSHAIDNDQIMEAARLINLARKPMALVGQGVILGGAEQELKAFLEKSGIPAAACVCIHTLDNCGCTKQHIKCSFVELV